VPSVCNVVHHSFLYSFIGYYMFRTNWPSSGVQVVVVRDSAAHSNAVILPPVVVASGYFSYVGYHQFTLKYNSQLSSRLLCRYRYGTGSILSGVKFKFVVKIRRFLYN
jgi:hypothetical protein